MTWNYRIVESCSNDGSHFQAIHEVYYDDGGNPVSVTFNPVDIVWEMGESTHLILKQIEEAFNKPILYMDDFKSKVPF